MILLSHWSIEPHLLHSQCAVHLLKRLIRPVVEVLHTQREDSIKLVLYQWYITDHIML